MSKIGAYNMDQEFVFDSVAPTTKRITVTTAYTYTYEVAMKFRIDDDDQVTSLLANGTPIDEGVSGDSQELRDLATTQTRLFNFKG